MFACYRGARRAASFPRTPWIQLLLVAACGAAPTSIAVAAGSSATDDSARVMKHPLSKYEILVSATRTARDPLELPNGAAVVTGEELRRRGARTFADAIQDVAGLTTGDGSDNGLRLPNIGMWGLTEFDALLITLDGVPVGGPFNPSLSQINVNDIDRIEVVKGPQGTMYGVSGFAGMIQVFSRHEEADRGHVSIGGGSFSNMNADGAIQQDIGHGIRARLSGLTQRSDGWQDRTGSSIDRGGLDLSRAFGRAAVSLDLSGYRDNQKWGTPLPMDPDGGTIAPGFVQDHNYAVNGARIEHRVFSAVSKVSVPLESQNRIELSASYTRDNQTSLRSFPADFPNPDTVGSAGVLLRPFETTVFGDAHYIGHFNAAGEHELVGGTAITWGRTVAKGIGFDFDQALADPSTIPGVEQIPVGDHREFEDRRTFFGVYAHDEWTPERHFTLSGGGRFDDANEKLHAVGQEVGSPAAVSDDAKTSDAWSGDLAGLVRLLPEGAPNIDALNLYGNWKSSFKPAAPNLTEAENAKILEPERTHSIEGGIKLRALARQVELAASMFQLDFSNLVISNLDSLGNPTLINGGTQRFKGGEVELTVMPNAIPGLSLTGGYAHHDARFVHFTFVDPDGNFIDVSGNRLELTPAELFNARASYHSSSGITVWGALRHGGDRALDRDDAFFLEPYDEYDAGGGYDFGRGTVTVVGRNLGNSRRIVAESDIGDAQFYLAPKTRVNATLTVRF